VFKVDSPVNDLTVKMKKLADHPIGVGGYPNNNSKIMAEFAHYMPGAPGYYYGNNKRRKNHGYAYWSPKHAPAKIFKQPKNDV